MNRCPSRKMVLLIDFDEQEDRLAIARRRVPENLNDRVFILGVWSEPEQLKSDEGRLPYEALGNKLAQDCRNGTDTMWGHRLLRHNAEELVRCRECVRDILFPEN